MGINGLWDVLGDGEVRNIADYAAEFWQKQKRPMRIAVDEACWRFTNLTDEQRDKIRQDEPAANPQEKVILWRILRLWKLNIQLLFVWDGMRKAGKSRNSGRGGGKVDDKVIKLLHLMFDHLGVPYHRAPREAEAECARLQQLGIVDAVWSDDGDSFMFNCTTLIKAHKVNGKRVDDCVRIYEASKVLEKHDFDADSLVLFTLLGGGDYDKTGLRGCGPSAARVLARRQYGLAKALKNVDDREISTWRQSLVAMSRELRKPVYVPLNFPKLKALNGYRNPAVSTDDKCRNLRRLE